MDVRRRTYRPEVVGALEDRLVLSAVTPVNLAAFEHGPQLHPVVVDTVEGSDQAKVVTQSGKPLHGQLTFSAQEVALNVPSAGGPAVGTFKVDYHNESSKTITSASIEDTLGPDLSYVPGVDHVPADGQLAVTTGSNGSQVVELKLPEGIAPGAEGYLEFQAEAKASTHR